MIELTVEDLLYLHRRGIERHGGSPIVPETAPGALSSALHSASYNEGILGYSAALLTYIAKAQHLSDGNKRLAWSACVRTLELNGFTLEVGDDDAEAFVLRIVKERLEVAEVADELANWLIELE